MTESQGKSLGEFRRDRNESIRKHAEKGITLVIRRSSRQQENNAGSHEFQASQTRYLARFGIADFPYRVFDRIESAKEGPERELIEELIQDVASGKTGVIVGAKGSRITRSEVSGARLIMEARKHGALFIVNGELFNPKDHHQHARLMEMIIRARFENAERQATITESSYALATKGDLRLPLPTGMLWVKEGDPEYAGMIKGTAIANFASEEALAQHSVVPERGGERYHALPDPYPDVFPACSSIARWMIQTGDPREVLHRIKHDPNYPRPGLMPLQLSSEFAGSKPPRWKSASPPRLAVWFRSWGVYGVYHITPTVMREISDEECPEIHIEDAFPSFLRPEDRERVLIQIADARREFLANGYKGPRNDFLTRVVCWHPGHAGPCNGRLYPCYNKKATLEYVGGGKVHRGHGRAFSGKIADIVLDMVAEAFEPESVEAAIATLRRGGDDSSVRREMLKEDIAKLESKMHIALAELEDAKISEDDELVKEWRRRLKQHSAKCSNLRNELARLQRDASRYRALAAEDFERMRALARDIPACLRKAREIEAEQERRWAESGSFDESRTGLVRRIVGTLVSEVRVHQVARGAYHITVVFPHGGSVSRTYFPPQVFSQAELAWIEHRSGQGISVSEIADELNAVPGRRRGGDGLARWNPDAVRLALARLAYGVSSTAAPDGKYRSVAELVQITGVTEEVISGHAFRQRLGPARVVDGQLCVRPTLAALDRAFPEYARGRIARRMRWPLDDVAEIGSEEVGAGAARQTLQRRADRGRYPSARDRVGRRYARISDMRKSSGLDAALADASDEMKQLDPDRWMLWEDIQKQFPTICLRTVRARCPRVHWGRYSWYHVVAESEAAFKRPTVEDAVGALKDDSLRVTDFYSVVELMALLQKRFGRSNREVVAKYVRHGSALRVVAWGRGEPRSSARVYVHVPEQVLANGYAAVIAALGGPAGAEVANPHSNGTGTTSTAGAQPNASVSEKRTPLRRRTSTTLEQALSIAPKEWRALDKSRWCRLEQAQEIVPGIARQTLRKYCPYVLKSGGVVWYYLDEGAQAALARPTLEEAVAALGDDSLRVSDFQTVDGLVALLQARYRRGSYALVYEASCHSDVVKVIGWNQAQRRPYPKLYVHVPEPVLAAGFEEVEAWLRGKPAATDGS